MPANEDQAKLRLDLSQGIADIASDLGVSFTLQNRDLVYVDARNRPFGLDPERFSGHGEEQLLGRKAAMELRRIKETVFSQREPRQAEIQISESEAEPVWHKICVRPSGSGGEIDGVISASIDVTPRRMADEHLRLALLELSHRAKNLLAIVLSMARQTSAESRSLSQFESRFEGRVRSLALAHDILTEEKWRGASLFGLVHAQMSTFASSDEQLDIQGYNAYLRPNAAQHLGLALHELFSWSVQSGALSHPAGRVRLTSERHAANGVSGTLTLRWNESGIPKQKKREESAFGQALLTQIVPASMDAVGRLHFADDGLSLRYELILPPQNYF